MRCWLVAALAITSLIQIALVSAANLSLLPLSGLGLPLLSLGTHSAVALGICSGLASAPLSSPLPVLKNGES